MCNLLFKSCLRCNNTNGKSYSPCDYAKRLGQQARMSSREYTVNSEGEIYIYCGFRHGARVDEMWLCPECARKVEQEARGQSGGPSRNTENENDDKNQPIKPEPR